MRKKVPHCTLLPIVNDFVFFLNGKLFYYYGKKTQNGIYPKMIKIAQIWINQCLSYLNIIEIHLSFLIILLSYGHVYFYVFLIGILE